MENKGYKKPATGKKEKATIETDLPLSEKDEIKKAEEKMRETSKKGKKL